MHGLSLLSIRARSRGTGILTDTMHLLGTSYFIGPGYHAALLFSWLGSIVLLFVLLFSNPILWGIARGVWPQKAAKILSKDSFSKLAPLIPTASTNAFHSINLFLFFHMDQVPTNSVAPSSVYKAYTTHNSWICSDEGLTLENVSVFNLCTVVNLHYQLRW